MTSPIARTLAAVTPIGTDRDRRRLAQWRLLSQHLSAPHAHTAIGVLDTLLAVQAENPSQSAWAVATRTTDRHPHELATALTSGAVVRTHVLRPTWHYVAREDLDWLLALTGARVQRVTRTQLDRAHGLSEAEVATLTDTVVDVLSDFPDLVRDELATELRRRSPATADRLDGQAVMILLAHLELARIVSSGSPRDGVHTYALFADRVGTPVPIGDFDRSAALGRLAVRYFTGHGPATVEDLSYWATLTITDARRSVERAGDQLCSLIVDDTTYWYVGEEPTDEAGPDPSGHLLQVLDEMYRGYQSTRMVIDAAGIVPTGRETAIGMALVDGQLVARMKRELTAARVRFTLTPLRRLARGDRTALEAAAARYGDFLGRPAELVMS